MSKFKVPATFTVPDTIEGVVGLLTARGWEKAAIVYAWTKPDKPGPKSPKDRTEIRTIYGIREFAALGITGLRTPEDVSWYRQQWIASGLQSTPQILRWSTSLAVTTCGPTT